MRCLIKPLGIIHNGLPGNCLNLMINLVTASGRRGRGYQYYVKWKDYPILDASWEPAEVFSDDGDLLTRYKEHHQLKFKTCSKKK